ncbi:MULTISPECIES: hypothetical protein [unclassified Nostoc]|uniref:hypothetical protein n=1 Tax=unclassified Nostoc TaxID=2593658 RepID=UPI002AD34EAA|nr:hypothetical protein [Nostoc sp. DedQUE03]MDZ7975826.1 hypothetical protein [Nostoc sp. DedQUE03]MDZ8048360.1 hypothetical protein [Nostoc sp. DedQUE02]
MTQKQESNQNNIKNKNFPWTWISVCIVSFIFGLILFWSWRQQLNKAKALEQCISRPSVSTNTASSDSDSLRSDLTVSPETINRLKNDICENLIIKYEYASNINWFWNLLILFSSVGATLALAIADDTKMRAFLGCFATALVSIRSVIPVAQWSAFHQSLAGEGRSLLIRLNYSKNANQPAEFEEIVKAYERAILHASSDQPTVNSVVSPTPDSSVSPTPELNTKPQSQ